MKFRMYQVPVTETYAIRSQVIMDASPQSGAMIPGAGNMPDEPDPFDPEPNTFD